MGGLFALAVDGAASFPIFGEGLGFPSPKPDPEGLESLGGRFFAGDSQRDFRWEALEDCGGLALAEEEDGCLEGLPPAITQLSVFQNLVRQGMYMFARIYKKCMLN